MREGQKEGTLHGSAHHEVRLLGALPLQPPLVLPPPLGSKDSENDRLARSVSVVSHWRREKGVSEPDGRDAQSLLVRIVQWGVEEPGDDVDASAFNLSARGVLSNRTLVGSLDSDRSARAHLFDVDEVHAKVLDHELLRLVLLIRRHEGRQVHRRVPIHQQLIVTSREGKKGGGGVR